MNKKEIERYNYKASEHLCRPQRSNMEYHVGNKKKGLSVVYCVECGKTLRNYTWKERDDELREKNKDMLQLIGLYN